MIDSCRVCGTPLTGKQTVACCPRHRAQWNRQAGADREQKVRRFLEDVVRLRHPRLEREGRGLLEEALRLLGSENRA